jgi:Ca2+-transporting ATPase
VATLIVTELGFLKRIFDTVPLTSSQWGVCLLAPIIYVAIVELMKLVERRLERRHQVPAPATA